MSTRVRIKHVDGVTDVAATLILAATEINLEYRLDGMTYGRTMTLPEAIKVGVIKKVKANNNFRSMKKGEIYPILSFSFADRGVACEKGDMIVRISCGNMHFSNFEPAL